MNLRNSLALFISCPLILFAQSEPEGKKIEKGVAAYQRSDFNSAIIHYTNAIEMNPKSGIAYGYRAEAFLRIGRFHEAIADCNKAIDLNSNLPQAYFVRGKSMEAIGK